MIIKGSLQGTDTASFIETYASAGPGVHIPLTPSGVVDDGNNGNNYTYKFVQVNAGTITSPLPTVVSVTTTSQTIVVQFSGPLGKDAKDAHQKTNYSLVTITGSKSAKLASAKFNATAHTVTLKTKKRPSKVLPLTLTIDAAGLGLAPEDDPLVWTVTVTGATANDAAPPDESTGPSARVVDALLSAGFHARASSRRRNIRLRLHDPSVNE
jgi:hypothetical protein